jgi:hypothetical protein
VASSGHHAAPDFTMRSFGFTFLLLLVTAIACTLAAWHWKQGNFDLLIGKPPTPVGDHIYSSFTPEQVKHINISTSSTKASFTHNGNGWQATTPWDDRMDPRAAGAIINFTLGMRVEDVSPVDKVDIKSAGLGDNAVYVRLEDENHKSLAKYKLGRISPWKAEIEGIDEPINTTFVETRDIRHHEHIYLCTGDISPLFKSGLKLLRDHRPFYFNPLALQKINIHSQHGNLTLGRENPKGSWRIVKPLDLPTDPSVLKTLIEGLFNLQAIEVKDRAAVTLPATDSAAKTQQIAITHFGSDRETILEIYPPESVESQIAHATISDRPNTMFELPLKPSTGQVSLADLPLDVNALRDPTLTHLNIASLQAISIIPATGIQIVISKAANQPWMANTNGSSFIANEENLYALLKAVSTQRAIGFVSDAATDFSPWGLDRPIIQLRFLSINNEALELRFGIDTQGNYFANRLGTPTVMRVDPTFIKAIAVHPYEWKHSAVWTMNPVNLTALSYQMPPQAPLNLKYNYDWEKWTAEQNNQDLSATVVKSKADLLLYTLESLKCIRWLASDDSAALTALASPSLQITSSEEIKDEDDNKTGVIIRTIKFAAATDKERLGFYYGQLNSDLNPFLIDSATYQKLTVDLFKE